MCLWAPWPPCTELGAFALRGWPGQLFPSLSSCCCLRETTSWGVCRQFHKKTTYTIRKESSMTFSVNTIHGFTLAANINLKKYVVRSRTNKFQLNRCSHRKETNSSPLPTNTRYLHHNQTSPPRPAIFCRNKKFSRRYTHIWIFKPPNVPSTIRNESPHPTNTTCPNLHDISMYGQNPKTGTLGLLGHL